MSRVGSVVQCGLIYNKVGRIIVVFEVKKEYLQRSSQKSQKVMFLREYLDFFDVLALFSRIFFTERNNLLFLGAFTLLADEGFVNVRDHTASSNGGLNKCVQFFISSDGQL